MHFIFRVELGDWFEVVLGPGVMDQPGSEAVGIGVEAHVNISELFASAERLWRRGGATAAPRCNDKSRDDSGAVHFYVHPRNMVTLSLCRDVKDRSSPVDSTWKKRHPEGPRSVCCSL